MKPERLDVLLNVMGLAPSKWTLAAQLEREAAEAEKRAAWRKWRKGKGFRQAARRQGKRNAEKRRKRFAAANGLQGSHGPNGAGKGIAERRKRAMWLERSSLKRFRPLEQVQRDRAALWGILKGGWMARADMIAAGADARWLDRDLTWLKAQGAAERRNVDPLPALKARFGQAAGVQWRATGDKAPLYEPGPLQAGMYAWQTWAETLNG